MESTPSPSMLKFGPYVVDLRAGELRKYNMRIRLQEKPLRVLAALAEGQGQLVTREELKAGLWADDTFVDFEAGLNTAVSKLRDALSDNSDKPIYIETIPRRGYRFLVPVELVNGHRSSPESSDAIPPAAPPPPSLKPAPAIRPVVEPPQSPRARPSTRFSLWISL